MAIRRPPSKGKPRFMRKRRFARRRRPQRTLVNRALHPIPQRYITKHKYCETVSTDVNGLYTFNLNSLYDPNRTGIGHQPYGYDTLATMYNRYRVISCGWRVTGPRTDLPRQIASMPSNDPGITYTTFSEIKENPRAKYVLGMPGAPAPILKGKAYIPSIVGRTKAQYMADDRYQAAVTGSPQEEVILYLLAALANDNPDANATLQVTLEYTVEWFDIKHLIQS